MTNRIIAIISICTISLLTASAAQEVSSEYPKIVTPGVMQIAPSYEGRENLNEDMPLTEALIEFNSYLSEPKLTEEEVIASVRRIKAEHPTISEDVLAIYSRVIDEKILPKGMDFRTIHAWEIDGVRYKVDWRDLVLDTEHSGASAGFGYRIRDRFISSSVITEEEKKMRAEKNLVLFGKKFSQNDLNDPAVQKWLQEQKDKEKKNK